MRLESKLASLESIQSEKESIPESKSIIWNKVIVVYTLNKPRNPLDA